MKTIVVTGGTGGIGEHTATTLSSQGHRVVVTGRDAARGAQALARIRANSGNDEVHLALADMADLAAVDALADEVRERFDAVDVLVNNAGVVSHERTTTVDGIEEDFAVNVVAPWRLTTRLLPSLRAAAPARVVNLTGGSPRGTLQVDDLQAEQAFTGLTTYTSSKLAMEAMSLALARELDPDEVTVTVVYPGAASTAMTQAMDPSDLPGPMRLAWPLIRLFLRDDGGKSARKASRSSVFAATSPALDGQTGRYVTAKVTPGTFNDAVLDEANQDRVIAEMHRAVAGSRVAGEQ